MKASKYTICRFSRNQLADNRYKSSFEISPMFFIACFFKDNFNTYELKCCVDSDNFWYSHYCFNFFLFSVRQKTKIYCVLFIDYENYVYNFLLFN